MADPSKCIALDNPLIRQIGGGELYRHRQMIWVQPIDVNTIREAGPDGKPRPVASIDYSKDHVLCLSNKDFRQGKTPAIYPAEPNLRGRVQGGGKRRDKEGTIWLEYYEIFAAAQVKKTLRLLTQVNSRTQEIEALPGQWVCYSVHANYVFCDQVGFEANFIKLLPDGSEDPNREGYVKPLDVNSSGQLVDHRGQPLVSRHKKQGPLIALPREQVRDGIEQPADTIEANNLRVYNAAMAVVYSQLFAKRAAR